MKKFWCFFFIFWPIVAIVVFAISPSMNWWFPGDSVTPIGVKIDDLFYLILVLTGIVFVGTQVALGYVLWKASCIKEDEAALYTHGSHKLEIIWTIIPAAILLFITYKQMDVWAEFRMVDRVAEEAYNNPVAEVMARQFEWRMRYPGEGEVLQLTPQPNDLYAVNELVIPTNKKVVIHLRTEDVQHSFFAPHLRVKQDAVPGKSIPVWFEVTKPGDYELVCAELCGWGHYKMKGVIRAMPEAEYKAYLLELEKQQSYDGVEEQE